MEEYLRLYVNHCQGDWANWLPMCELAANNAVSDTTGITVLCELRKGSRMNLGLDKPIEDPEQARAH